MTKQCQSTYTIDFHTKEKLKCERAEHSLGNHIAYDGGILLFWKTVEEDGFWEKRGRA